MSAERQIQAGSQRAAAAVRRSHYDLVYAAGNGAVGDLAIGVAAAQESVHLSPGM